MFCLYIYIPKFLTSPTNHFQPLPTTFAAQILRLPFQRVILKSTVSYSQNFVTANTYTSIKKPDTPTFLGEGKGASVDLTIMPGKLHSWFHISDFLDLHMGRRSLFILHSLLANAIYTRPICSATAIKSGHVIAWKAIVS